MRPGQCLGLVLCVPFSALTLTAWWQGHVAPKNLVPLISRGSVPEQVEAEDLRVNPLTRVHLEQGSSSSSSSSSSGTSLAGRPSGSANTQLVSMEINAR